ncbi:hypothetical protein QKU48_gp1229 [Fadolivirus algeromassiliense]|jgi:hypothetical protein|uniref:Uncharacterized protein n=1 Tax=Fadolivirus FV1/VV64 TaxID=3070911 RepID=A0A7D3QV33_9VIRU|nr:hypothetical protein QKU48_gp1229 [Fadolivirus algeromassiliense]QKF94687.1 hypothetical protein Fadolivirus_1_1229 [Fadolivirus FV1/VV64]
METSIVTLVNELYNKGGFELIRATLNSKGFIVKPIQLFKHTALENRVIIIFYKNHIQLWEKWARQSRGVILLHDGLWRPIKFMFDRGAELLTQLHKQSGIEETENMTLNNTSIFSPTQQRTIKSVSTNSDIDGYLTTKVDGMLVTITCYTGTLGNLISDVIERSDDEFGKTILHIARELDCKFIPVIATQKTFNVTEVTAINYIVTSFLTGLGIALYEQLTNLSAITAMELYGKELIKKIMILHDNIQTFDEFITFSFEAVCKNRTCAWNKCHEELAVDYDKSLIRVLSYSHDLTTVPHFMFSDIISLAGFQEPLWWKITNSMQITSMLNDLSKYILGELSHEDYLKKYNPSNVIIADTNLDPEGFIFWAYHDGLLDYNKVKVVEYYDCHNPNNIKKLLQIAKKTTIFPAANATLRFFTDLKNNLITVCHGFRYAFNLPFDSHLINNDVLKLLIDGMTPYQYLYSKLSDSAKKAFDKQDLRKKCLMLMNVDGFYSVCKQIFTFTFKELVLNQHPDLGKALKNIIHVACPWEDPSTLNSNLDNLISELGPYVNTFYLIIQECKKTKSTVDFLAFNVFGCPDSTDIDVIVSVSRENIQKEIDIEELKRQLTLLGYDTDSRDLDINVVYVENGNVELFSKASDETQNILYLTYKYHKQAYPCLVDKTVMIDIKDKVNATIKFIMDHMRALLGNEQYHIERENRRMAYASVENKLNFTLSILHKIKYQNRYQWNDAMKSLSMKIIQLMLMEYSSVVYTKEELAIEFDKIYPGHYNHVKWFLFRGKFGTYSDDCLKILVKELTKIAVKHSPVQLKWTQLSIDTTQNPTELPDNVISEFIKSPFTPTDAFVEEFGSLCSDRDINKMFPIRCVNTHLLPENVLEHCVLIDQRSKEWIELLTYYTCGRNTGVKPYEGLHWVQFYYNLIRGAIVELFTMRYCDFSNIINEKYERITLGFLVEDKNLKGSSAIAPDLLLMTESKKIIPVEIKCLEQKPIDNHDYRRGVYLATKQLETSIKILGTNIGIIVLVYVYKNDNDLVVYDPRATIISF